MEILQKSTSYFVEKNIESPRLTAELLLADTLSMKRLDLYLNYNKPLRGDEVSSMREKIKKRVAGCPTQYILGETGFRHLRIKVTPAVFIPRPETEIVVGTVIEWIKDRADHVLKEEEDKVKVLDIGTGSGNIALSISKEVANAEVVASDVSDEALKIARENAVLNSLDGEVDFRLGELFQPISPEERFHVIVSNPPYIPEGDLISIQREVRDHEPRISLTPGKVGTEIIERLIILSNDYLEDDGLLAFEMGDGQADAVNKILLNDGRYRTETIVKDLHGIERGVLAIKLGKWKN